MADFLHVKPKSAWKRVQFDRDFFSSGENIGPAYVEVLENYDISKFTTKQKKKKEKLKAKKKRLKKEGKSPRSTEEETEDKVDPADTAKEKAHNKSSKRKQTKENENASPKKKQKKQKGVQPDKKATDLVKPQSTPIGSASDGDDKPQEPSTSSDKKSHSSPENKSNAHQKRLKPSLKQKKQKGAKSDKKATTLVKTESEPTVSDEKKSETGPENDAKAHEKESQPSVSSDKNSVKAKSGNKGLKPSTSTGNESVLGPDDKVKGGPDKSVPVTPTDTDREKYKNVKPGGMKAWNDLFVPNEILWALKDQGFEYPTPIQIRTLPHAIRDKMDILGAAETGSGKTLAFGIPLIHYILQDKLKTAREKEKTDKQTENTDKDLGETSPGSDEESDAESSDEENTSTDQPEDTIEKNTFSDNTEINDDEDDNDDRDDDADDSDSAGEEDNEIQDVIDRQTIDGESNDEENNDADGSSDEEFEDLQEGELGCVRVVKDIDFSWFENEKQPTKKPIHTHPLEGELGCVRVVNNVDFSWFENEKQASEKPIHTHPFALILEPTRELAIQVKQHLTAVAKYTDIKIATIVGGMSVQKQRRVLKRCPDIVVATPGRLWDLQQEGASYLSEIEKTEFLVIDEADRMVEKGHFEELSALLLRMNRDPKIASKRHSYVFSATLTTVHEGPQRYNQKKNKMKKFPKLTETQKLESLMQTIGLKAKPKIVDLSRKVGTVETLTEARIHCSNEEKDVHLYYFLKQYPGRTLVFCNSKDCIRRLVSVFDYLKCKPLPLHADMHQRQRLKNLDRFKGNPRGLLIASDVAARGLDIPNVQHVIHFQVPNIVENYIHRSGRTARALKEGISVVLIGPSDMKNYKKIINTLNREEDLPLFPVDTGYLAEVEKRVDLVREIETQEYRFQKGKRQNDWLKKMADESGIEIDDEGLLADIGDDKRQAEHRRTMKHLKAQLDRLLKEPIVTEASGGKFPTKLGKLDIPVPKADIGDDKRQAEHRRTIKHLKAQLDRLLKEPIVTEASGGKFPTKLGKLDIPVPKANIGDDKKQAEYRRTMKHLKAQLDRLLKEPIVTEASGGKFPTKLGKLDIPVPKADIGDDKRQAGHRRTMKHLKAQLDRLLKEPIVTEASGGKFPTKLGKLDIPIPKDIGDDERQAEHRRTMKHLKAQLDRLLKEPIVTEASGGKFPTKLGKLDIPVPKDLSGGAIAHLKTDKKKQDKYLKQLRKKVPAEKPMKKKKDKWAKKKRKRELAKGVKQSDS